MNKLLAISVSAWCILLAVASSSTGEEVDYSKQIKPILSAKCYSCHGALKQEGELRLETRALMIKGGDSGEAIFAGKVDGSLLMQRVTADNDERMPPAADGTPLQAKEIALIGSWIRQGAQAPHEEIPGDPREHWAFKKPLRPEVPQVKNVEWSRNPIDGFLAAKHEKLGLTPVPVASKRILLRRVHLDLIGLPPTRQQLQAFLEDDTKGAYEKVVRNLLQSPQYGERWGRHWMDVWRYSDWYGLGGAVRSSHRHIWRWRDWIVQSLNEDKAYGRMLVEMLAGDEIAPLDPETVRATGFLARNWWVFNRDRQLDDTIEHTLKAFLGLTMNCTKCHDHKYDPIPQVDYYRMRAFFEPYQPRLDPVSGEIDLDKNGLARVFDLYPDRPTYRFIRGNDKDVDKDRVIQPGVPDVLDFEELNITAVALPPEAFHPELQPFVLEDHLSDAQSKIKAAQAEVQKSEQQLAAAKQASAVGGASEDKDASSTDKLPTVAHATATLLVAEKSLSSAELRPLALSAAHVADVAKMASSSPENLPKLVSEAALAARKYEAAKASASVALAQQELVKADSKTKANAEKKLTTAQASLTKANKAIEQPGQGYTSLRVSVRAANGYGEEVAGKATRQGPFSKVSTGRRTALAGWIASPNNPLTARVAVNHIWLRHFGQPLVESVSDFGLRTDRPTQHALLDWLAVEFMENQWSMKHLHHLIVTSRAYQSTSGLVVADESTKKADPLNRHYWRRQPQRMESQVVRDSLLHLAGVLDTTIGGPSIAPNKEDAIFRRSLYFTHSRDDRAKFVSMFDDADVVRCYRRGESIIPQQALALANSKLALTMSRRITAGLRTALGDATDDQFITTAFETVLQVQPTEEESAACLAMLKETAAALAKSKPAKGAGPADRARENLVHALLNHNDFVTIR